MYHCHECKQPKPNGELYPVLINSTVTETGIWALLCLGCLKMFQEENRIITQLDNEITPELVEQLR